MRCWEHKLKYDAISPNSVIRACSLTVRMGLL